MVCAPDSWFALNRAYSNRWANYERMLEEAIVHYRTGNVNMRRRVPIEVIFMTTHSITEQALDSSYAIGVKGCGKPTSNMLAQCHRYVRPRFATATTLHCMTSPPAEEAHVTLLTLPTLVGVVTGMPTQHVADSFVPCTKDNNYVDCVTEGRQEFMNKSSPTSSRWMVCGRLTTYEGFRLTNQTSESSTRYARMVSTCPFS